MTAISCKLSNYQILPRSSLSQISCVPIRISLKHSLPIQPISKPKKNIYEKKRKRWDSYSTTWGRRMLKNWTPEREYVRKGGVSELKSSGARTNTPTSPCVLKKNNEGSREIDGGERGEWGREAWERIPGLFRGTGPRNPQLNLYPTTTRLHETRSVSLPSPSSRRRFSSPVISSWISLNPLENISPVYLNRTFRFHLSTQYSWNDDNDKILINIWIETI